MLELYDIIRYGGGEVEKKINNNIETTSLI